MRFTEIKRLWKRCNHFCRQPPVILRRPIAGLSVGRIKPVGAGVAVHNFALMRSHDYAGHMEWLAALAASLNRYIDNHRIEGDENALRCLRWWRAHLFFDPGKL